MGFEFNPADEDPHGECRHEIQRLKVILAEARRQLAEIVCTDGDDAGVILKSWESPTHYSETYNCLVYDHENFSELGNALVKLAETLR